VSDAQPPKLVDLARNRELYEATRQEIAHDSARGTLTIRAVVRVVDNYEKEARVGRFVFRSDEHPPDGKGSAPSPLGYFVAAVGF
jgi:hypothetical protein